MRTFFAHLSKEWREQRWILLAAWAAIALLTAVGAWALRLSPLDFGRFAPVHVAGATALAVLALSTELFAAEGRRDGFGFLRRTPGALPVAWGAKTAFFLASAAATAAVAAVVLLGVATAFGGDVGRDEVVLALGDGLTFLLTGLAIAAGLWILMVSVWIPRGAAAAGAALLLLAALGAPGWWLLRENPGFRVPHEWTVAVLSALFVVPLVGAALGLMRGLRVARHSWSAAWRGLALVGVVAAPAYAAGIARLDRWLDLWPDQPDVQILSAYVGRDGRHAWVNAYRPGEDDSRGYHARPFSIDLESGVATPLGPMGTGISPSSDEWANAGYGSQTLGILYLASARDASSVTWLDAGGSGWTKTLPYDVTTSDVLDRRRASLRRATVVRRPDGRPTWIVKRSVEYDAPDGSVASVPLPASIAWARGLRSGGWQAFDRATKREVVLVPTDDGGLRTVPWNVAGRDVAWNRLSPERYVCFVRAASGKPAPEGGAWRLVDSAAGTDVPAKGFLDRDALVAVLDANHALLRRVEAKDGPADLWRVDPSTGESTRLSSPPDAPSAFGDASVVGWTPSGALILSLSSHGSARERGYALLDAGSAVLRDWTPWRNPNERLPGVVASFDDGSAILLEAGRRLVRVRWGSPAREVLYPR